MSTLRKRKGESVEILWTVTQDGVAYPFAGSKVELRVKRGDTLLLTKTESAGGVSVNRTTGAVTGKLSVSDTLALARGVYSLELWEVVGTEPTPTEARVLSAVDLFLQ